MEAARYGCNILHGPNVSNFTEIYQFFKKKKNIKKISNQKQIKMIDKFLKKKNIKNSKKIEFNWKKNFKKTIKEINKFN